MTAAGAWFRPVPGFNHGTGGLQGILNLRALDDGISEGSKLDELISNLSEICRRLMTQPKHLVTIHGNQSSAGLAESWATNIQQATHFSPELQSVEQCQAFVTTTQVNHCAQVFATVPENHEDAPALAVLAGVLRNGYLHRAVRSRAAPMVAALHTIRATACSGSTPTATQTSKRRSTRFVVPSTG